MSSSTSAVLGCICLLLAVSGIAVSIAGVTSGWAKGSAHDLKPSWGPWGPSPGVDLDVWLGWWNCTTRLSSSSFPAEIAVQDDSSRVFGASVVVVFGIVSILALYLLYHAVSTQISNLPAPDVSSRTLASLSTGAGLLIMLLSIALYTALAWGAHRKIKDKMAEFSFDVEMWPHPSWAFAGGIVSGASLVTFAWLLPEIQPEVPVGYMAA